MRLIKYFILAVLCVGLIVIALANQDPMTLQLLPAELASVAGIQREVTLPMFIVILGAVVVGLLIGFIWEWLREHKHRATAATERRERQRLEREMGKVVKPTKPGDDILAILDGN